MRSYLLQITRWIKRLDSIDRHTRNRWIFGDNFAKLQNAKIVIFGIGGVGGHALDALWRSGVQNITVIDSDKYEITNQNRQINSEFVGEYKTDIATKIYGVKGVIKKADQEYIKNFDFDEYDLVLDCIDDIPAKVAIARYAHKKLISSMGAAKRIDPTQIKVIDIWQTANDPFASLVKKRLKYENFRGSYKVVFSTESPLKIDKLGSFIGVTGAFGLAMASTAISRLIRCK